MKVILDSKEFQHTLRLVGTPKKSDKDGKNVATIRLADTHTRMTASDGEVVFTGYDLQSRSTMECRLKGEVIEGGDIAFPTDKVRVSIAATEGPITFADKVKRVGDGEFMVEKRTLNVVVESVDANCNCPDLDSFPAGCLPMADKILIGQVAHLRQLIAQVERVVSQQANVANTYQAMLTLALRKAELAVYAASDVRMATARTVIDYNGPDITYHIGKRSMDALKRVLSHEDGKVYLGSSDDRFMVLAGRTLFNCSISAALAPRFEDALHYKTEPSRFVVEGQKLAQALTRVSAQKDKRTSAVALKITPDNIRVFTKSSSGWIKDDVKADVTFVEPHKNQAVVGFTLPLVLDALVGSKMVEVQFCRLPEDQTIWTHLNDKFSTRHVVQPYRLNNAEIT